MAMTEKGSYEAALVELVGATVVQLLEEKPEKAHERLMKDGGKGWLNKSVPKGKTDLAIHFLVEKFVPSANAKGVNLNRSTFRAAIERAFGITEGYGRKFVTVKEFWEDWGPTLLTLGELHSSEFGVDHDEDNPKPMFLLTSDGCAGGHGGGGGQMQPAVAEEKKDPDDVESQRAVQQKGDGSDSPDVNENLKAKDAPADASATTTASPTSPTGTPRSWHKDQKDELMNSIIELLPEDPESEYLPVTEHMLDQFEKLSDVFDDLDGKCHDQEKSIIGLNNELLQLREQNKQEQLEMEKKLLEKDKEVVEARRKYVKEAEAHMTTAASVPS